MRVAAALLAAIVILPVASDPQQEERALAELSAELSARSGPGFWGETAGVLVRDDRAALGG